MQPGSLAFRLALGCVAALLMAWLGYAVGRSQQPPRPPLEALVIDQDLAPGAAADRYAELNRFLDAPLTRAHERSRHWQRLARIVSDEERRGFRQDLRERLLDGIEPWPGPAVPLAPREGAAFRRRGIEGRIVTWQTLPGVAMTGAVLIPENHQSAGPALLVLHGMYGGIDALVDDVDYHHALAAELARAGFVVLAPLRVATTIDSRNTLYVKGLAAGLALEAIDLWQLMRSLDYLAGLAETDATRLGVVGISLGGQHALWLAALDDRISAAVSMGYFADRFSWLFGRPEGDPTAAPGKGLSDRIRPHDNVLYSASMDAELDDLNWLALLHPKPIAIVMGARDPRARDSRRRFADVRALYERTGHGSRAVLLEFEGRHEAKVAKAADFFGRWLEVAEPASAPAGR